MKKKPQKNKTPEESHIYKRQTVKSKSASESNSKKTGKAGVGTDVKKKRINIQWDWLKRYNTKDMIGFVMALFFMLLTSIFVSHYVENHKIYLESLKGEVQELRWHYTTRKSRLMKETKPTAIVSQVDTVGMEPLIEPIRVIEYNPNEY